MRFMANEAGHFVVLFGPAPRMSGRLCPGNEVKRGMPLVFERFFREMFFNRISLMTLDALLNRPISELKIVFSLGGDVAGITLIRSDGIMHMGFGFSLWMAFRASKIHSGHEVVIEAFLLCESPQKGRLPPKNEHKNHNKFS